MKTLRINLNDMDSKFEAIEDIEIYFVADVHIGDPLCDLKLLKETIKHIQTGENRFCILNGDILNTATKNSVSFDYEGLSPMEELRLAIDLFKPLAEAGKILGVTKGNHEKRVSKETSIDVTELMCIELGIKDRYCGTAGYLFLHFGEKEVGRKAPMCYTLYFTHGSGGGTTIGAKANKLTKLSGVIVADVIAMSHLHQKLKTEDAIYVPEYGNKVVKKKEIHYVMNNSFLDYGGYGEEMGLKPTTKSLTKITLNGRKREID